MELRRYSVKKLEKKTEHKKIICFGSGNHLYYIFQAVSDTKLGSRIKYIVDNDRKKWGKTRDINGCKLEIKPPEEIKREEPEKVLILITLLDYNGVLRQLDEMLHNGRMWEIVLFPEYRYWFDRTLDSICKKLPFIHTILMQGEGDTCENARAVEDYMRNTARYSHVKTAWLCDHPQQFVNTRVSRYILRDLPMKEHSVKEALEYYSIVDRAYLYLYENKMIRKARRGQKSCYMNHGIPLKATKGKIVVYEDTDYVLSSSPNITHIFVEQYQAKESQIVICGSPRTDLLYQPKRSQKLADYLELSKYHKMILWAPTFRTIKGGSRSDSEKNFRFGVPVIDSGEALLHIQELLAKEKVLLVLKPHVYQELPELFLQENGNIRIVEQDILDGLGVNVYDLMKLADSLLTDYSSIAFDYLILDRPIGYTIDDMEQYTIGFSVENPLDYMPGDLIKNADELEEYILQVCHGKDVFREKRKKLRKYMFEHDDGRSCERLLNILGVCK